MRAQARVMGFHCQMWLARVDHYWVGHAYTGQKRRVLASGNVDLQIGSVDGPIIGGVLLLCAT
jgi:hypothetical protein